MARDTTKTPDFVLGQMKEAINTAVDEAISITVEKGIRKAEELSSGTKSTKELRQMDHPYAKRHKSQSLSPEIINKQTGLFKNSWQVIYRISDRAKVLANVAPYANYVLGGYEKGTMIRRPIDITLEDFLQKTLELELKENLKKLEK